MTIIGHLDMDAFFAAVEERDKPRLKGRPIVVGADPLAGKGRGVVSTANYAARKFGIRSALPIQTAWRLAKAAEAKGQPKTVFMSGSHDRYSAVSQSIMEIISTHSPLVQPVGIDEAYFDLSVDDRSTGSAISPLAQWENAKKTAQKIKREIQQKENLTCSIGIGPNKLIAKIASDYQKPDGLTIVTELEVENFLAPLPVRVIPGVGPKAEAALQQRKIGTIKDLKRFRVADLEKIFGKWGDILYERARGRGDVSLAASGPRKSIGEETTFRADSSDAAEIAAALKKLCRDVHGRFGLSEFSSFRTIVMKIRFANFITKSRSKTFPQPIADVRTLEFESLRLLVPFFEKKENPRRWPIRLIGVRLEKLA